MRFLEGQYRSAVIGQCVCLPWPPTQTAWIDAKGYGTILIHTGLWYKYNHGTDRKYTHHSRPNIERARVLTVLTVLSLDHA